MKMDMLVKNTYWKGKKGRLPFEKGILCGIKAIKLFGVTVMVLQKTEIL